MTRKIIVHSTFVQGDGSGDLAHLLNWLKVFTTYYRGKAQQHVLIFAIDPDSVTKELCSLHIAEPAHPIFNFFRIDKTSVISITAGSVQQAYIGKSVVIMGPVDLKSFFANIADDTNVSLFKISSPINLIFKDLKKQIGVENTFGIFEFDGTIGLRMDADFSALGLGNEDFGLLHDIGGITGLEPVDDYLLKLTPKLKKLIFQNQDISIADAKVQLAEVPIVFVYLSGLSNMAIMSAVLRSPIIKAAIVAGKKPLFFITRKNAAMVLPENIRMACNEGKIRIVTEWLSNPEYRIANALFMNRETNSLVIPAGDNTLTSCIKAGKFPFYAHQWAMTDFMRPEFKYGIFRSILKILDSEGVKRGWNNSPGFDDCKKALTFLSKQMDKTSYKAVLPAISQPMLTFFRDTLAPYLMENFAFEKKSLPRLLKAIHQIEERLAKPKPMTVMYVEYKEKMGPTKETVEATKDIKTAGKSTNTNSFGGLKAGFLL